MRTAAICPTCATYTNAVCVLYDGPYLSNLDIAPLTDLEEVIGIIDAKIGTIPAPIGYTPENVANKSTNTSLGTSDTLYPSQNAVKTYVDTEIAAIPIPDLEQVTSVNNATTLGIYSVDDLVLTTVQAGLLIDVSDGPVVTLQNIFANISANLTSNKLSFTNGAPLNTVNIKATNIASSVKNIELPNASGTFALSVNSVGASTTGNVSVTLQSVLNAGNSLSAGRNFQGTSAGVGNTGNDVIGFGMDAGGGNSGSDVTAFGTGAAQGNALSGVTVFSNLTLPTYANHAAALLAITVPLGATPGCTYLYHNQATDSIGAVRL
jgi:hypothetical protein